MLGATHPLTGIVWLALTVAAMVALARGEGRAGRALENRVLATEARVTLIDATSPQPCSLGSRSTRRLDGGGRTPLAGLVIAFYGGREGRAALREAQA